MNTQTPLPPQRRSYKKFVVAVIVIVLVVIIIHAASSHSATSNPGTGTSSHPATADFTLNGCQVDPTLQTPEVTVNILNHSSGTSDYTYQVNFLVGNTVVAQGAGLENNIAPGQGATDQVTGDNQTQSGNVTCELANVTRYASS